jgi:hypothetical protein
MQKSQKIQLEEIEGKKKCNKGDWFAAYLGIKFARWYFFFYYPNSFFDYSED